MRISDWSSDVCSSDLHAAANLLFDLQHTKLALHESEDHFEPLRRRILDEQSLLVRDLDVEIARDRIGEARGVLDLRQLHRGFGGHLLVELGVIFELVDHRAHQRRGVDAVVDRVRSEEHTSELQSLMRISYAVFCLNKKNNNKG